MKLEIIREKTTPEQPIKYVYYGISERENETGEIISKGEIIINKGGKQLKMSFSD